MQALSKAVQPELSLFHVLQSNQHFFYFYRNWVKSVTNHHRVIIHFLFRRNNNLYCYWIHYQLFCILIQTPFQVFESTTVRAIRKYKFKEDACLNLLFRRTRYHYKFLGSSGWSGIEVATIQNFHLHLQRRRIEWIEESSLHTCRGSKWRTKTGLPYCNFRRAWRSSQELVTSVNFSLCSIRTGNLYQPSWRGRGGGPGSRLANAGRILRAARRQLIADGLRPWRIVWS